MKLTDEVMNDLLTLYLAGEASADTRALIENHARQNAAFASKSRRPERCRRSGCRTAIRQVTSN